MAAEPREISVTNRISAFVVVLDEDLREDDAQATIAALHQIKGVLSVQPHVADVASVVATARVRSELWRKLYEVLYPGAPT